MSGLSKDTINNDAVQYEYVKNISNVYSLKVREKNHGVCMYPYVLKAFINKDVAETKKIFKKCEGKLISKWRFSVLLIGFRRSVLGYMRYMYKRFTNIIKRYLHLNESGNTL